MADNLWPGLFRRGRFADAPTSPDFQGETYGFWHDTETNELKFWSNTGWLTVGIPTPASYPEVATFADLPLASGNSGAIYIVQTTTGIIGFRKLAGLYRSDGAAWNYLGLYGRNAVEIVNVPAGDITATDVQAALNELDSIKQPIAAVLTATTASFTTAQETKLSGIAAGATANQTDAYLLARANHTGEQAMSTVTGLIDALGNKQPAGSYEVAGTAATAIIDHVAEPDPHTQYLTEAEADALYLTEAAADTLYEPIGGGGGGLNQGTATIDFGSFPGSNEGSVTFANTGIGSALFPFIASNDTTTDHTANDHKYAAMLVQLSAQPDPGVGGTIYARSMHKMQGTFDVRYGY